MNILVVLFLLGSFEQVFLLDVVQNKTGAEQVKDALSKAEKESNLAAKTQDGSPSSTTSKNNSTETKNFLNNKTPTVAADEKLDKMIDSKVKQLDNLRKRHNKDVKSDDITDDGSKNDASTSSITASLKKTENAEKENSDLEEASDQKMASMAKKLNTLVAKFQKKIGHLESMEKKLKIAPTDAEDDDSTKKITRSGKPAMHTPAINLDVGALRRALGLIKSKELLNKNADDSNGKASYKEDVKLEDKLALEAEEEKKVTSSDNYDDYSASEAAAGVDKSSVENSPGAAGGAASVSPKDQASQEMQSYNALISSESNRELSQIQDEINKATQSSMGKVSVIGQRENVQTESPSFPGLPGLTGDAANIEGNGPTGALEGLLNGGGGGAGGDPLAAAIAAGGQGGEMGDPTGAQATSINDLTGQQQPGNSDVASLNLGGGSNGAPIEVGSSTPVDMGMFGANNQQGAPSGPENGDAGSFPQESSLIGQQQNGEVMTGEQYPQQDMAYKKSKISASKRKQKKSKVTNKFLKAKNYKRTVARKHPHHKRSKIVQ